MSSSFVIGTRGSALALWQARAVQEAIAAVDPDARTQIRVITTEGDREFDQPLEVAGDKGLFTRDLECALTEGEVDLCVHSMKDMPIEIPDGCAIRAMLPRADARDVLVCGPRIASAKSLAEIPVGARLGTGSMRRTAQLRALFPHVAPIPIRGNVDTRLRKAHGPDFEGVVLAAAGVVRLGAESMITAFLPVDQMVPAVGQGAIGIETRTNDDRVGALCAAIDDPQTSACVRAERLVLAELGGGCQTPIGVFARFEHGEMVFDAAVCAPDGSRMARVHLVGADAVDVVRRLRCQGADEILSEGENVESAPIGAVR